MLDTEHGEEERSVIVNDYMDNRNQGVCEEGRYLAPINSKWHFCYNISGHDHNQRVVVNRPGKCPKCGKELEPGGGGLPL
ncbi:hypothetical protein KKF19_00230 [Patescibacteria group bacterium]|nr:hypothetical protein [Patescibacteria group bacterium]